ncbi:MAG TPA: thioredoxin family protein [Thermoplasmata archaeon]|nr:thioredoxin family protein [Thermoplasmata archaeon]
METVRLADFDARTLRRSGSYAVAFLADWCGFCRDFVPRFRALEPLEACTLAIVDVTDQDNPLWERFSIEVVPTVIGFVEGELGWRRDGVLGEGLGEVDLGAIRGHCRARRR